MYDAIHMAQKSAETFVLITDEYIVKLANFNVHQIKPERYSTQLGAYKRTYT